jgi:xylose isomerase
LAELSDLVLSKGIDPKPRSGRQEALENLVNRYV